MAVGKLNANTIIYGARCSFNIDKICAVLEEFACSLDETKDPIMI